MTLRLKLTLCLFLSTHIAVKAAPSSLTSIQIGAFVEKQDLFPSRVRQASASPVTTAVTGTASDPVLTPSSSSTMQSQSSTSATSVQGFTTATQGSTAVTQEATVATQLATSAAQGATATTQGATATTQGASTATSGATTATQGASAATQGATAAAQVATAATQGTTAATQGATAATQRITAATQGTTASMQVVTAASPSTTTTARGTITGAQGTKGTTKVTTEETRNTIAVTQGSASITVGTDAMSQGTTSATQSTAPANSSMSATQTSKTSTQPMRATLFNFTTTKAVNTTKPRPTNVTRTTNLTTTANLTATILPTSSPQPRNSSKKSCFPSSATVQLRNGSVVRMEHLSIGDDVKVGPNAFSKVYIFTHKISSISAAFLEVWTASGASITLTSGHYIHSDGALIPASMVQIGATVHLGDGQVDHVVSIHTVSKTGLYNPQTLQGDIVVDGVLASTYTTAIEPELAHIVLVPFRSLFKSWNLATALLEGGGGFAASLLDYIHPIASRIVRTN